MYSFSIGNRAFQIKMEALVIKNSFFVSQGKTQMNVVYLENQAIPNDDKGIETWKPDKSQCLSESDTQIRICDH